MAYQLSQGFDSLPRFSRSPGSKATSRADWRHGRTLPLHHWELLKPADKSLFRFAEGTPVCPRCGGTRLKWMARRCTRACPLGTREKQSRLSLRERTLLSRSERRQSAEVISPAFLSTADASSPTPDLSVFTNRPRRPAVHTARSDMSPSCRALSTAPGTPADRPAAARQRCTHTEIGTCLNFAVRGRDPPLPSDSTVRPTHRIERVDRHATSGPAAQLRAGKSLSANLGRNHPGRYTRTKTIQPTSMHSKPMTTAMAAVDGFGSGPKISSTSSSTSTGEP